MYNSSPQPPPKEGVKARKCGGRLFLSSWTCFRTFLLVPEIIQDKFLYLSMLRYLLDASSWWLKVDSCWKIQQPTIKNQQLTTLRWLLRRGSPLPIPNREVKPACADGTAVMWESMSSPFFENPVSNEMGFFVFSSPQPHPKEGVTIWESVSG